MVNNMNKLRTYLNGDRFFQTVITVLMVLFLLIELYPLIYVVSASLSDADAVAAGKLVLWPIGFTLQGYEYLFQNRELQLQFLYQLQPDLYRQCLRCKNTWKALIGG